MKLRILTLTLAFALGSTGIAQAATEKAQPRTLVKVNGEEVKETHFLIYRAQRGGQAQHMDQQAQVGLLNELVNTVMIAQDAEKSGLAKHPELVAAMDVARYRILAEAAVENHLKQNPVTDQELEAAYKAQYSGKRTEYKARHILLETEDAAKAVIAELDKGADFAKLAQEKSTGPSGKTGGDLGWFEKTSMVKPFGDAVASMKKGSHSAAPVQTRFGWHVIKLEDSREQDPPALESVKAELTQQLSRQKLAAYVQGIRARAKVDIIQPKEKPAAK